jgi:anti-anti-sigma regulatory factor
MTPEGQVPAPAGDSILLGEDGRGFYFRVTGSVRAVDCYPLREDILERLEAGKAPADVYADLSSCRYMDSTFIGLLVAMDSRLKKGGLGRLRFTGISHECMEALSRLGLDRVFSTEIVRADFPKNMRALRCEKPGVDFILKAHEALMESSEEARKKFGLLRETLFKKLKKQ